MSGIMHSQGHVAGGQISGVRLSKGKCAMGALHKLRGITTNKISFDCVSTGMKREKMQRSFCVAESDVNFHPTGRILAQTNDIYSSIVFSDTHDVAYPVIVSSSNSHLPESLVHFS